MSRILIIDDDAKLIRLLTDYLRPFEFEVVGAGTPTLGLKMLASGDYDLVILDVMLPEKTGFEVLKDIRATHDVPVIMLTARGELTDRVVGLELGADDYLPKPFEPRELVARIQTVLRRGSGRSGKRRLVFGPLTIDPMRREVFLDGEPLDFSTAEYEVLALLASEPRRVFPRETILERLHGSDWAAFDRAVDVLVSRIRGKLGDDPKRPCYIKTVWGTGYKFVGGHEEG